MSEYMLKPKMTIYPDPFTYPVYLRPHTLAHRPDLRTESSAAFCFPEIELESLRVKGLRPYQALLRLLPVGIPG
jgi:hypothetical protein